MSNAKYLIENAIYNMAEGRNFENFKNDPVNKKLLNVTGIKADDVYAMATHVVYALYDGEFPYYYPENH